MALPLGRTIIITVYRTVIFPIVVYLMQQASLLCNIVILLYLHSCNNVIVDNIVLRLNVDVFIFMNKDLVGHFVLNDSLVCIVVEKLSRNFGDFLFSFVNVAILNSKEVITFCSYF
jgi:hypothetical protein